MLRKASLMAAMIGLTCFVSGAIAEDNGGGDVPPSCPGGGTATGTFHCTGPVGQQTCTEGPPWKCAITATGSGLSLGIDRNGFGSGGHRGVFTGNPALHHPGNLMVFNQPRGNKLAR